MEDNMGLLSLSQQEIQNKIEQIMDNPELYFSLNKRCRRNGQILTTFLIKYPEMYNRMNNDDKKFVTADMVLKIVSACRSSGCVLEIFHDFNSDEKICSEAVRSFPKNVKYINKSPEVFKRVMMYVVGNIRLKVSGRDKDAYNTIRKDKYQYVYYIPEGYLDEDLRLAIEKAIIRNIELDKILYDIGYGNGITY
ncbi:MAG: hypothetical protein ACLRFL_02635 [Clostridia bacterium]